MTAPANAIFLSYAREDAEAALDPKNNAPLF